MAVTDFREGKLLQNLSRRARSLGGAADLHGRRRVSAQEGVSGATVFRGIEGFGGHNQMHVAKVFSWFPNLPILIEVVDDWSVLEPLLPQLEAMVGEGLMTIEAAQYLRLVKEKGGTASAGR